jgi:hypothetical protein
MDGALGQSGRKALSASDRGTLGGGEPFWFPYRFPYHKSPGAHQQKSQNEKTQRFAGLRWLGMC